MKIRISDMMDPWTDLPVPIQEEGNASAERIKEVTMRKIQETRKTPAVRRPSRAGLLAAALAAALCVSAGAAAVLHWNGFARTGGMTDAEIAALLEEVQGLTASEYADADGTVHYQDGNGKELFTLSAQDAARYEREKEERARQSVLASTDLADLSTMEMLPASVAELTVDAAGAVPDFALGCGSMVLLHPEGAEGFSWSAGQSVTLRLTADRDCRLQFGLFRDGSFLGGESVIAQEQAYTFSIPEDGCYLVSVQYFSSDAGAFQAVHLTEE